MARRAEAEPQSR